MKPVLISLAFLVANVIILLLILRQNLRSRTGHSQTTPPPQKIPGRNTLEGSDILGLEFEYARTSASGAMQDRHHMMHYYLLVFGIVISGVVAILKTDGSLLDCIEKETIATMLLWLLCGVGWFYFLAVVRLRQAWYDSARAMNQIKEFYIQHTKEFDADVFRDVFLWQTQTLPAANRTWTLNFNTATLIGFLDSVAYVAGGALTDLNVLAPKVLGFLILFGFRDFSTRSNMGVKIT